jgi:hypothetical protein
MIYCLWLFSFPPSINHDDAFHFLQGVERFSILEFRPHFPGYPGYMALAKVIYFFGISPMNALFILSNVAALCIPILSVFVVSTHRLAVFLFALSFPLLPLLGLSLLSDGIGIAFFLASLVQFRKGNLALSGSLMGLVLACRPSFILPVACIGLCVLLQHAKGWQGFVISGAITCTLFFGSLFLIEGTPLIWEGLRFIEGHFLVWGNTALSDTAQQRSWVHSLSQIQGAQSYAVLMTFALLYATYKAIKHNMWKDLLFITCCATWGWTLLFQNPENLRHLALPLLLSGLLIAHLDFPRTKEILICLCLMQVVILLPYLKTVQEAPLQQVKTYLENQDIHQVLSQQGIFYLRKELPSFHIYDAFYDQHIKNDYWRLTTTPKTNETTITFPARILGEKSFSLIEGVNRSALEE